MAISAPHYRCLLELHRRNLLPQGGSLLEIGEANWYGDIAPPFSGDGFEVVKAIYRNLFDASRIVSIDLNGRESLRLNLNQPIQLNERFAVVYNHGTAEHIFNVANVFRVMHEHCKAGGLMIHESPFTGWIDHGFWTIQPTAYADLAEANGYTLIYMAVTRVDWNSVIEIHTREQLLRIAAAGGIPNNSMLYVALLKNGDAEFRFPMQGFYDDKLSEESAEQWRRLR